MIRVSGLTRSDKKNLIFLILWLLAGLGMVTIGIVAFIRRNDTINTVSGVLGVCALLTGIVTAVIRFAQHRLMGGSRFTLDWIIWIALAILLFNTNILNRIGSLAFVILGAFMVCEGIRAFICALNSRADNQWYVPRLVFSVIITVLGIVVICNSMKIFKGMVVLSVGVFFIVHGLNILNDWIGRAKYFYNYRGTENEH